MTIAKDMTFLKLIIMNSDGLNFYKCTDLVLLLTNGAFWIVTRSILTALSCLIFVVFYAWYKILRKMLTSE